MHCFGHFAWSYLSLATMSPHKSYCLDNKIIVVCIPDHLFLGQGKTLYACYSMNNFVNKIPSNMAMA